MDSHMCHRSISERLIVFLKDEKKNKNSSVLLSERKRERRIKKKI